MGSTPIGGPAIGFITAAAGARAGLGVGALSCFVAALLGLLFVHHLRIGEGATARVAPGSGTCRTKHQPAAGTVAETPEGSLERRRTASYVTLDARAAAFRRCWRGGRRS